MNQKNKLLRQHKKLLKFCLEHSTHSLLTTEIIKLVVSIVEPLILLYLTANILTIFTQDSLTKGMLSIFEFFLIVSILKIVRIKNTTHHAVAINQNNDQEFFFYAQSYACIPYYEFEKEETRDLQKRVRINTHSTYLVTEVLSSFLASSFQLVVYMLILFQFSKLFSLLVLCSVVFHYFVSKKIETARLNFAERSVSDERKVSYIYRLLTDLDWSKEIRLGNFFPYLLEKSETIRAKLLKNGGTFIGKTRTSLIFIEAVVFLFSFFQYGYIAYQFFSSNLEIGQFILIIGAINNLTNIFQAMTANFGKWMIAVAKFSEHQKYMALIPEEKNETSISQDEGVIEFREVSFNYPDSTETALSEISFTLKKGEALAIVGGNGSGKSTIIKLLCRFYKPSSGKIFYKGKDIWLYSSNEWQDFLSIVFQDFQLYSFSVADNLSLSLPKSEERMKEVLDDWGMKEKIEQLPYGLDTQISKRFFEEGVEFSGGELQKIAGSRAQYKEAPIFIFDEVNANFDVFAEELLYSSLNQILNGKWSIFITHRLGMCRLATQIIVLDKGNLIQTGTHQELINQKGVYSNLFCKQTSYS
ncbi:ATP-binding cassette, subfamily B, bacterial [Enterococcus sp. AZ194]|uniref:ABC transporter ATP-binding protein n=1 Tax=Enterococcus sp. AZ194 TaxID=2774629 RepID=UPI003F1EF4DA